MSATSIDWRAVLPTAYPMGVVPLADICEPFFGINYGSAIKMAAAKELPVPALRLGSRKAPWMVAVDDLIRLVDERSAEAREVWSTVNEAA